MKLGELEVGTEIDIEVKIGGKEWLFHDTILQFIKGVALMEPLSYEGKIINIAGDDVGVSVYVNDDEDIPMQFRGCVVKNLRLKDKTYLAIACNNEGKRVNRRNAFRIFVGEDGYIEPIGSEIKRLNVVVRDLSLTGFSFVTDVHDWDENIRILWLNFDGRYGEKMRLQGSVVRTAEGERERLIVGCQIVKCANDLETYVSFKQRENLKRFADKRE
ncbi:MAG: PilZ domain-containing protein [Lachnospiraceae bacterium]|nr:PilZ domain-containing protein [Lachnospiraceae bacterium]